MSRRAGLILRITMGAVALVLLGIFAYSHGDQTVRLDFGLFALERVPLPVALYGSIILGMLIVLGVSVWSDLSGRGGPRPYERRAPSRSRRTGEGDHDDRVLEEADRRL